MYTALKDSVQDSGHVGFCLLQALYSLPAGAQVAHLERQQRYAEAVAWLRRVLDRDLLEPVRERLKHQSRDSEAAKKRWAVYQGVSLCGYRASDKHTFTSPRRQSMAAKS